MQPKDSLDSLGIDAHQTCIDGMKLVECMEVTSEGCLIRAEDAEIAGVANVYEYFPHVAALRVNGQVEVRPAEQARFEAGRRQFVDSAGRLSTLERPALPKVESQWQRNGTNYAQTAHYSGQSLSHILQTSKGSFPPELVDRWLTDCAQALAVLRNEGIVQGPIFPHRVKVLFKDAQIMMPILIGSQPVIDEQAGHSPWFAPEQLSATDATFLEGPWTDVYTLSALASLIVDRRAPLSVKARLIGKERPLAHLQGSLYRPALLEVIDRGLALDPSARPQTLDEWLEAGGCRDALQTGITRAEDFAPMLLEMCSPASGRSAEAAKRPERLIEPATVGARQSKPASGLFRPLSTALASFRQKAKSTATAKRRSGEGLHWGAAMAMTLAVVMISSYAAWWSHLGPSNSKSAQVAKSDFRDLPAWQSALPSPQPDAEVDADIGKGADLVRPAKAVPVAPESNRPTDVRKKDLDRMVKRKMEASLAPKAPVLLAYGEPALLGSDQIDRIEAPVRKTQSKVCTDLVLRQSLGQSTDSIPSAKISKECR